MLRSLLFGLTASVIFAATPPELTVDELVAKNIQARGGLEKIKSVKSSKATGRISIGPGTEAPIVVEQKRPNKSRLDTTIQGMTLTQAYDGKTAWVINPFGSSKTAEPLSREEMRNVEDQSDIDGPLVDWKAKGHKVELVGKDKVEGTDTYKLKVTLKSGTVRYLYLDAELFLDIKTEGKRTIRGTEVESEQTIGDYKEVKGILYPHSLESGVKGRPQKQKITIEKIELDVPIDDSRFTMPTKKESGAEKR